MRARRRLTRGSLGFPPKMSENTGRDDKIMEKIKILVVDDESRMRKLVRDFLVRENYEVRRGLICSIRRRRSHSLSWTL